MIECPLSGPKQTSHPQAARSAFDPTETLMRRNNSPLIANEKVVLLQILATFYRLGGAHLIILTSILRLDES
jgi:hypothetical protein